MKMKKHAILLSGGINRGANAPRYKNDLEFAYEVLVNDCGFDESDIEIFYANGADLSFTGNIIKTKEAKKEHIIESLRNVIYNLNKTDEFVLIVSNHGGEKDGGNICLWGCDTISLEELSEILQQMEARKILLLGECYAGNILDYNISNACVMTANIKGKVSYAWYMRNYDEFLYHFLSYIHGFYPDGNPLKQKGENNIKKAFQYAVDMDFLGPHSIEGERIRKVCKDDSLIEIPQMKCDILEEIAL